MAKAESSWASQKGAQKRAPKLLGRNEDDGGLFGFIAGQRHDPSIERCELAAILNSQGKKICVGDLEVTAQLASREV